ncbi:hypothetical protein [Gimesia maris]|jgi:hypothetical protein|uniref:Uncharacterized protein n=1 Tax=Gimesia maris TaxID=122 RepID=A0A3D3RET4_9PLAN|nr:hypothetical protein [Gimesia maris]MAC52584.1 hypothetical protein [Gimesia sp.]HAW30378.1 hypothetical protein [Planctomycetaceae bacterium]EDL58888.1 hypothetical protein PM8797T_20114 [Gimesia maris DSM 8797]QDT81023.1 hypothetical protein Mal35_45000 [Gimesia maris]QDU16742.1 hypothetical protein CA11_45760 [Gimesia maris]|tara:strand:- start:25971 stop:26252 length:282 start_codon:yes stop_codon:yes gene_type:complete
MQQLVTSPPGEELKTIQPESATLTQRIEEAAADQRQILSISVLEWLNAELRKEVEKKEIVAFHPSENVLDRLQSMLTSKATGITIMVVGLFMM